MHEGPPTTPVRGHHRRDRYFGPRRGYADISFTAYPPLGRGCDNRDLVSGMETDGCSILRFFSRTTRELGPA